MAIKKISKPIEETQIEIIEEKPITKKRNKLLQFTDKKYRIKIYKLTHNSRKIFMPQATTLGIWHDLAEETDFSTYSETNALDIIIKQKDLDTKQFDSKIAIIKYIDL